MRLVGSRGSGFHLKMYHRRSLVMGVYLYCTYLVF